MRIASDSTDAGQAEGQLIRIDPLNPGSGAIELMATLTPEQRGALTESYIRGKIETANKTEEMARDVHMFGSMLGVMAAKTREVSEQTGAAITMQKTHQWSVGKTEVVMGNTDQARSGRLTRTMTGDGSAPGWSYALGAIFILILVSMFVHQ